MKGSIVECMQDLVTKRFGAGKWKETLKAAGLPETKMYSSLDDVPDAEVMSLMKGVAQAAKMTTALVMEAFGEHWSTQFAPTVYKAYFATAKSTRELLLNLDQIHVAMTRSMKSARPPRFKYEWKDDKHLVMHYQSQRGLVALMPGLIRGLGKRFKDDPKVHVSGNEVHVHFA
jgi:hypothetical protein